MSGAMIVNGMMNIFPCATIVDCPGSKHFSVLMEKGGTTMIDREKIIKAVDEAFNMYESEYGGTSFFDEKEWAENKRDALFLLKEQEAVVRCKDCKHYRKDTCSAGAGIAFPPPEDWFCADGEKR